MQSLVRNLRGVVMMGLFLLLSLGACASVRLGQPFKVDPQNEIKVGHDTKADVVRKMGQPYRSFVDGQGREVLTYVWADGDGGGQKAVIGFNQNGVAYLVEVAP